MERHRPELPSVVYQNNSFTGKEEKIELENNYPSDFLSPEEKAKKQYALAFAKALYEEYTKDLLDVTGSRRQDFIRNRKYAQGSQDTQKYKRFMASGRDPHTKKLYSYVDLDWSIVSLIPKFRDIVLGYNEKIDHEFDVMAMDKLSNDKREDEKFRLFAEKKVGQILAERNIESMLGQEPQAMMFDNMEELEVFMRLGGAKLQEEVAIKQILEWDLYINNWPEIKKTLKEDLFDLGRACVREYTTPTGNHVVRACDPVNLLVKETRDRRAENSKAIGEIVEMSLADLWEEAGSEFTREDYIKIVKAYTGTEGEKSYYDDFIDTDDNWKTGAVARKYDGIKIKVLDTEWYTVDEMYYEQKPNAIGESRTYRKEHGYNVTQYNYFERDGEYYKAPKGGGKEVKISQSSYYKEKDKKPRVATRTACKMVYGCKWVVGTDFVYQHGKAMDMPRKESNLRETNRGFHYYKLSNNSHVERMIPFADAIQLTWLKIQNAKAKARPKGLKIELDALQQVVIDGKTFNSQQILALYDATGNLLYKGTGLYDDNYQGSRHSPVEEMKGGMGNEYQELVGDLNMNIEMLRQVSGFNEVFDGSTPNPNTPVGTQKLATTSTLNSLQPFLSAFEDIALRTAESSVCRLKLMSKYKMLKGYEKALGENVMKIIEVNSDLSAIEVGLKIVLRPTADKIAKIEEAILRAMQERNGDGSPQLTYPDYLFLTRIMETGNLRFAEAILSNRISKRQQEAHERSLSLQKANQETQMASAQQTFQNELAKIQAETEAKIMYEKALAEFKIMIDNNMMDRKEQIEKMKAMQKSISDNQKAETTLQVAEINHESKASISKKE